MGDANVSLGRGNRIDIKSGVAINRRDQITGQGGRKIIQEQNVYIWLELPITLQWSIVKM